MTRTYHNDLYGYEVQYPEKWKFTTKNNKVHLNDESRVNDAGVPTVVMIISQEDAISLESWYKNVIIPNREVADNEPKKKNITINGYEALDVRVAGGLGNNMRYIAFYKEKKVFYLLDTFAQDTNNDINSVISSFKFTKTN